MGGQIYTAKNEFDYKDTYLFAMKSHIENIPLLSLVIFLVGFHKITSKQKKNFLLVL